MERKLRARLESLPKTEASFIEPMECLSVSRLPEGPQWVWEVLCGPPHKIMPRRGLYAGHGPATVELFRSIWGDGLPKPLIPRRKVQQDSLFD